MKVLTLLLVCLNVFILQTASASPSKIDYQTKFERFERLQKDYMSRLRFRLSEKQLKKSMAYKVVLLDQFDDSWLFKAGIASSMDGAISIYRLGEYLGVPTPEMHYLTLNLNGENVTGSVQRLLKTKADYIPLNLLGPKSHQYMAQQHALSWLTTNHHVHPGQFIYPDIPEDDIGIQRIDNSVNWFLLGHDELNTFYTSPMVAHVADAGYFQFWNDYLSYDVYLQGLKKGLISAEGTVGIKNAMENRKLNVDLQSLYSWILFFQKMPDDLFLNMFKNNERNNFMFSGNNSPNAAWYQTAEFMLTSEKKEFLPKLLKRKKQAHKDFKKFYQYLAKAKGEKLTLKPNAELIEIDLTARLNKKIEILEKKLAEAPVPTAAQAPLMPDISLKSHIVITPVFTVPLIPNAEERIRILTMVMGNLEKNLKTTTNEAERKVIQNALENLERIKKFTEKENSRAAIFKIVLDYHRIFEKDGIKLEAGK